MAHPTLQLPPHSRRDFCLGAGSLLLGAKLQAFGQTFAAGSPTRPDVAAVDHDRIIIAADRYLAQAPTPITAIPCPRNPGSINDYYSERAPESPSPIGTHPQPLFLAHRDAVFNLGLTVPALTSAYLLTRQPRYADHAAQHLRAWFVTPATRMAPRLDLAQSVFTPPSNRTIVRNNAQFGAPPFPVATGYYTGVLESLPLIEVAQSIPFLTSSKAFSHEDALATNSWFAEYLKWLTQPEGVSHIAALARDHRDHHATSWLLQASAYASLAVPTGDVARSEDDALSALRHQYKTVTLRSQLNAEGMFKNELQSETPYRDSLFNLDMMAAVCQLLSTRLENLWEYQLQDGPGMRSAIAYHFPFIADRSMWPFRADANHFDELPSRRSSLLFTARPYQRPEYASLWKKLTPDPVIPEILRTIAVHQPLLWLTEPPYISASS